MRILMMTNTYAPIVGGLERSVASFAAEYRRRGHRVLVVAPSCLRAAAEEPDVVRVPAIQYAHGVELPVALPIPRRVSRLLKAFAPDIIHAHHPFLLGTAALRLAHAWRVPLVFTHHVLFEHYLHYTPIDAPIFRRFVTELVTGYENLCDLIFAPSESVAQLLRARGVAAPIEVVPTGIALRRFTCGDGSACRRRLEIPPEAFVVGYAGRLAPEKNLEFLAQAVAAYLARDPSARFLALGRGPSETDIRDLFEQAGVADRLHLPGIVEGQRLADAYHAMDVFAFASQSETQGLVAVEAMAAGVPVVALDASGLREVVRDRWNGRLLSRPSVAAFVSALRWLATRDAPEQAALSRHAKQTAAHFAIERWAQRALELYAAAIERGRADRPAHDGVWTDALRRMKTEWDLARSLTRATGAAMGRPVPNGVSRLSGSRIDVWLSRPESRI